MRVTCTSNTTVLQSLYTLHFYLVGWKLFVSYLCFGGCNDMECCHSWKTHVRFYPICTCTCILHGITSYLAKPLYHESLHWITSCCILHSLEIHVDLEYWWCHFSLFYYITYIFFYTNAHAFISYLERYIYRCDSLRL